jgi:hypothetical protein
VLLKSLSDTRPDSGLANGPVDVHVYVDGRAQVAAVVAAVVEEVETVVELAEAPPLPVHGRH